MMQALILSFPICLLYLCNQTLKIECDSIHVT